MNCRDYCKFSQHCHTFYPEHHGEERLSPDDCPKAWRIEDMEWDAFNGKEEIPFYDENETIEEDIEDESI